MNTTTQTGTETLTEKIVRGDARAIARAISVVEDGAGNAAELMRDVFN